MKIMKIQAIFLISAVALLSCAHTQASSIYAEVIERSGKHGYVLVERELKNLVSEDSFEGKHFKIVEEKSNTPIRFDDPDLALKAANVYYHLSKARTFWVQELGSSYVEQMEQVTVRLNITATFSPLAHYMNDNYTPNYNNAYTVPGGKTPDWVEPEKRDEWGMEIWFSPMKRVSTADLARMGGQNPLAQQLQDLKGPIVNFTQNSFIFSTLNHLFYSSAQTSPYWKSVLRHAGTLAVTYLVVEGARKLDPLFMDNFYYLDTAMVPEIIYHEFAHAALSEHLEPSHATAVIEGMADYFATLVAGETSMYRKIEGFSNNMEKNALNKTLYHPYLENSWNATGDFVLSLLWKLRNDLNMPLVMNYEGERFASSLLAEASKDLDTKTSNIRNDLARSLMNACQRICDLRTKRVVLQQILRTLEEKGF